MKVITLTPKHETEIRPGTHRVMGSAADLRNLADMTERWEAIGVPFIEVIKGEPGEKLLDDREHSLEGFFESIYDDLSTDMRREYMQDVAAGRIVFTVPVTSDNSVAVVQAAQACGARHLARFGLISETYPTPV